MQPSAPHLLQGLVLMQPSAPHLLQGLVFIQPSAPHLLQGLVLMQPSAPHLLQGLVLIQPSAPRLLPINLLKLVKPFLHKYTHRVLCKPVWKPQNLKAEVFPKKTSSFDKICGMSQSGALAIPPPHL